MAPIGDPIREWEVLAPADIPAPVEQPELEPIEVEEEVPA